MSLADHVHIARRFQLSIRIDADLRNPNALEGFICPKSFANVLLSMANHLTKNGQAAFTWTGPYGSGKSSLALVLSAFLNGDLKLRELSAGILGKNVASALHQSFPVTKKGWRILPVVAQRAAPAEVIGEALIANKFVSRGEYRKWTDARVMSVINDISNQKSNGYGGLVVFLDEMGKFLEGAEQNNSDIYLFQQLAEAATRSKGRLLVIGVLHQAFDEYAHRLARDMRDEWAKVQGRFIDLSVNTTGDEQLELIAKAVQSDNALSLPKHLVKTTLINIRMGRPSVNEKIEDTLMRCWPLHPIVACLLGPISRRRFGQNQRSLFGFLNSAEPFGFQDFLHNSKDNDIYGPDLLWDYLRANLEPIILASPDGHRWSMAVEALERCEALGASLIHIKILKTIALIDLFRERSGLSSTSDLLSACIEGINRKEQTDEALKDLQHWSFVLFRKHLKAYSIYAGSDFDIEQALKEALNVIHGIDFKQLRALAGLQPILAKRHYHNTGALRWFDINLIPLTELIDVPAKDDGKEQYTGAMGRILLVIPTENEKQTKADKLCRDAIENSNGNLLIGLSPVSWQVLELAKEFLGLIYIEEERPELGGDSVARREVMARIADVKSRLEANLRKMLETASWYRKDHKPTRYSFSEISRIISDIADSRFADAPKIHNELLNRHKPSSNAIAAQKALLKLMVLNEKEPRLGINGFPAEGGLYESIITKLNLHISGPNGWLFQQPGRKDDRGNLSPAWNAAWKYLKKNSNRSLPITDLYRLWEDVPFGIKTGLLPILTVTFMLAHRNELAFYREGTFQARFTDLDIDYLTSDPSSIQLRWMDLSEQSKEILSGLSEVVRNLDKDTCYVHLAPINIARGLVAIYEELKPFVKKTNRISENALKIRNIFKQASDPNKFLFNDIPTLIDNVSTRNSSQETKHIVSTVQDGLVELTQAYSKMLNQLQQMMLAELQLTDVSPQALTELHARAENVHQLTGDFRLNAFISRLATFTGIEEDMEGIASLAVNKPPRDWVDADFDQAGIEIAELAQKFIRSEAYAHVKGRTDKRQSMAVVVGVNGRPTPVSGEFAVRDTDRKAIETLISQVEQVLLTVDSQSRNIILAALAEMSARYLDNKEGHTEDATSVGAR